MQDVLGLGNGAQMNHPGTVGNGNWLWRLDTAQLTLAAAERLREATAESRRVARAARRALAATG